MTIGGDDATRCRCRSSCMATQNPIESEGTYPLPEAQVDRFLMKILVDYPTRRRGGRGRRAQPRRAAPTSASACRSPTSTRYAAAAADGARRPRRRSATPSRWPTPPATRPSYGLGDIARADRVRREPARADRARPGGARAGAAARPRPRRRSRTSATSRADVLRHRIVLSYDALSEGVTADELLDRVLAAVDRARATATVRRASRAGWLGARDPTRASCRPPAARQGPGPMPHGAGRARSTSSVDAARRAARCRATAARPGVGAGTELAQLRPYEVGDDVRQHRPGRDRAHRRAARAPARARARADDVDRARRLAVDGVRHRASG